MTLKSDAKFIEKLSCGFKYDMSNCWIFTQPQKCLEIAFRWAFFCTKNVRFELQKYREVIYHDTEQWHELWIKPDLMVSNMAWGIGWIFIRALKSLRNCTLMGSFWSKNIIFQPENLIGIMYHELKEDTKFKRKPTRGLKNVTLVNLVNFHASSQKSENLLFDGRLLSKAYNFLDEKVQKSYDSWHWRVMQSLGENWLLVPKMKWRI